MTFPSGWTLCSARRTRRSADAGYRAFNQWAVENGYTIPLLQGVASSVYRRTVGFVPYANGWIMPQVYKPA